jgi:hypothetical protein
MERAYRIRTYTIIDSPTGSAGHNPWTILVARADARAADLAPTIAGVQATRVRCLRAIAAQLNRRGSRTPRGVGEWKASSIPQLLARFA